MSNTQQFAITAVGQDRPGIAAAITGVLSELEINVEDSRMTILGGCFTVMMLVAAGSTGEQELRGKLDAVRDQLELDAVTVNAIEPGKLLERAVATHLLTVYGADHPGIVSAFCAELARAGVNIDDLATRLTDGAGQPIYTLLCELTLPVDLDPDELAGRLEQVGQEQSVEVVFRKLEQDII